MTEQPAGQRCLVVGNQTLASARLAATVSERLIAGPCRFHVLVPATPPRLMTPPARGDAREVARARLNQAMKRLAGLGADVTGEVGHQSVILAIADVLRRESFDEIIMSTLPQGVSRWLRLDVPGRLSNTYSIPVTLLVAEADATSIPSSMADSGPDV